MNSGQIIFIVLIIGGIIFWNWIGRGAKRDEAERKARMIESERKSREEDARRTAERNERMRKYRIEYEEYIIRQMNVIKPVGGRARPLSFDEWREFNNMY